MKKKVEEEAKKELTQTESERGIKIDENKITEKIKGTGIAVLDSVATNEAVKAEGELKAANEHVQKQADKNDAINSKKIELEKKNTE